MQPFRNMLPGKKNFVERSFKIHSFRILPRDSNSKKLRTRELGHAKTKFYIKYANLTHLFTLQFTVTYSPKVSLFKSLKIIYHLIIASWVEDVV